jgi:hypothetical protein
MRSIRGMKLKLLATILVALAAPAMAADSARLLEKANVLPLALDDSFQFRKVISTLQDPSLTDKKRTNEDMLNFERLRPFFGALTNMERIQRVGHYFKFFWRAKRQADITVRLEYRQQKLGDYVQAREISYQGAKGSVETEFEVVGDDYREDGRITSWRALLIENGRVVGLTQSYLWN